MSKHWIGLAKPSCFFIPNFVLLQESAINLTKQSLRLRRNELYEVDALTLIIVISTLQPERSCSNWYSVPIRPSSSTRAVNISAIT